MRIRVEKLIRLAQEECGSELVEFAMTALVLMGLLFGMIEFMLAMYAYHFVSTAAQQGVRFAAVRGNTWSQYETVNCSTSPPSSFTMVYDCTASAQDIENYVQSLVTPGMNSSNVTIDETSTDVWPGTTPDGTSCITSTNTSSDGQGCLVKVKVTYNFTFLPFEKIHAFSMSATSQGIILQ
jgi:Flp pilus assembly protein TadG